MEGKRKREENDLNWNPGDCLQLILTPQTKTESYASMYQTGFVAGNMFKLIDFTNSTKKIVLIDPIPLLGSPNYKYDPHAELSQDLRSTANSADSYYNSDNSSNSLKQNNSSSSEDEDEAEDEDGYFYLPSKFFEKVNCNSPFERISTTPIQKAIPVSRSDQKEVSQKAIPVSRSDQKEVSDTNYYIISTSVTNLNNTKKNPYFYDGKKKILSENNANPLFKFAIVKIIMANPNGIYRVVSIENKKNVYEVNADILTPFTSMAGQDYIQKSNNTQVRVVSTDIEILGNVIIRPNGFDTYKTINPQDLIAIKGSDPRSEQSNFYPDDDLDEDILEIDDVKDRQNDRIKINCSLNGVYTNSTTMNMRKFVKTDDCFIEYMIEPNDELGKDPDTINIDKFMSSGEAKGAGKDLFCNFLCYISTNYPNIKFIKLVAQPRRKPKPTDAERKILQKMLNDYYRSLHFFKIDQDNEFMGCMSDLIKSCPGFISKLPKLVTFKEEEEEERGGSKKQKRNLKLTKRKSKKRRKSIKKNYLKKRRKSIRKRK